jgi:DNA-binding SARP family transcriptional activator
MARLSISLLGGMQVALDGQPVTAFESNTVRALLAYLAVEGNRPHMRSELACLLWPEQPGPAARTNLRHVLLELRRALGDQSAAHTCLLGTRQTIQLDPSTAVYLDVAGFAGLLDACNRHAHERAERCPDCVERLRQVADLYKGPFLAGLALPNSFMFEEWARVTQERLHQQALEVLYTLADYYEALADYGEAGRYARRQLALEPWREEAHQQLMRILARSGQRSAALAQYGRCRQKLLDELSLEPSAETTALYEQIRAGELGVATKIWTEVRQHEAQHSALDPRLPPLKHNMPAELPPPLAHESELTQLLRRLQDPAHRLVTLVGPGGAGKTALALAAARQLAEKFPGGVWVVPLAGPGKALGITLAEQVGEPAQMLDRIQGQELLLILDGIDRLSGAADFAMALLLAAPRIRLLVTSRTQLNIGPELVVRIGEFAATPDNTPAGYIGRRLLAEPTSRARRRRTRRQSTGCGAALEAGTRPADGERAGSRRPKRAALLI